MSVEQYKAKLKEFINANKKLEADFKVMKQEIRVLSAQNKELNDQLLEIAKSASLEHSRSVTIADAEHKMRELVLENNDLISKIKSLTKQNNDLTKENSRLVTQNKSLTDQLEKAKQRLKTPEQIQSSWDDA